jgi:hypothetical protein
MRAPSGAHRKNQKGQRWRRADVYHTPTASRFVTPTAQSGVCVADLWQHQTRQEKEGPDGEPAVVHPQTVRQVTAPEKPKIILGATCGYNFSLIVQAI